MYSLKRYAGRYYLLQMTDRGCRGVYALYLLLWTRWLQASSLVIPQTSCSPGTPLFDPRCFAKRVESLDDCWEPERCKSTLRKDEWEEPLVTLQDDMEEHHDTAFWLPGDAADVNGNLCWVVHNCSISRDLREVSFKTALLLNPEAVEKEPISDIETLLPSARTTLGEDALFPVHESSNLYTPALVPMWPGVAIAKGGIVESNGRINVCGKRLSWFHEGQIADMARKRPMRCDVLQMMRHLNPQRAIKHSKDGKIFTIKSEKIVFATSLWIWPTFSHAILDRLARLAPYLEFLQNNTDIKVHLLRYSYLGIDQEQGTKFNDKHSFSNWYELLGIDQNRLIAGNVRSDIMLFPATGPKPLNVRSYAVLSLAHEIKSVIQRKFPQREVLDNILVVRRGDDNCEKLSSHLQAHATSESFIDGQKTSKADRCVTNHRDLVAALYNRYRIPVAEFPSDRVHDLAEELFMWYSARVVIIPHGGALGNIVALRKDSIVIELGSTRMDTGKLIRWGRELCNTLYLRHYMYYPDSGGMINEVMSLNISRFLSYVDLVFSEHHIPVRT